MRKLGFILLGGCLTVAPSTALLRAQEPAQTTAAAPSLPPVAAPLAEERPLSITLPTALQLANAQAVDVAAAAQRVRIAEALLEQAHVLWLPTITIGGDYNRHDGKIQAVNGDVFDASRSSTMFGVGNGIGSSGVLNVNEAIFAPLVARQQVKSRQFDSQAASNDTLVAVSDAYFNVQQARGELAGAIEATRRTEQLAARTRKLAPALVPQLEILRAEAELARRQQAELLARQRWSVASAELLRVVRLDPAAQVEPVEPPHLRVDLIDLRKSVDDLIPIGLTNRPELASQKAQVLATLTLLKQERLRPLIPSVLLRGWSTPVAGTLAAGVFGGGTNSFIGNGGLRADVDLQVLWQLDNLGLGNRGRVHQRQAENQLAVIELFRLQDRVASEVARAHAEARLAAQRVTFAEQGVKAARESADKNLLALGQTKGGGGQISLLVRPQEAVAAVQALAQAYLDYYGAVADANRAQFRLYRALGNPAQCVQLDQPVPAASPATPAAPAAPPQVLPGVIHSAAKVHLSTSPAVRGVEKCE